MISRPSPYRFTARRFVSSFQRSQASFPKLGICYSNRSNPRQTICCVPVEDDDLVRNNVKRLLEAGGRRVETARDGLEALNRIRAGNEKFNLVVTDLNMPNINGIELARQLDSGRHKIPALVISGRVEATPKQRPSRAEIALIADVLPGL